MFIVCLVYFTFTSFLLWQCEHMFPMPIKLLKLKLNGIGKETQTGRKRQTESNKYLFPNRDTDILYETCILLGQAIEVTFQLTMSLSANVSFLSPLDLQMETRPKYYGRE